MPPGGVDLGVKYLYLFDPTQPHAAFPGSAQALYPGVGFWQAAAAINSLVSSRYYPSVTLTHRLTRLGGATTGTETVVVSGGNDYNNVQPNPGLGDPRNTFEIFTVRESTNANFVQRDPLLQGANPVPFEGPGQTTASFTDWLEIYPRLHLLSDGKVFLSGQVMLGAKGDPETPATAVGQWDTTVGRSGLSYASHRDYGTLVFFGRIGALRDVVVRLCGHGTDTAEYCLASQLNAPWQPLGTTPVPGGPRGHSNAVILPDGSIFVIGGDNAGSAVLTTALFDLVNGWRTAAPSPSPRPYHATAVLLPDGRVVVGGGEGRRGPAPTFGLGTDYDVYEPPYLHSTRPRPTGVTVDVPQDADGAIRAGSRQPGYVFVPR
jgi:hypothetical protein